MTSRLALATILLLPPMSPMGAAQSSSGTAMPPLPPQASPSWGAASGGSLNAPAAGGNLVLNGDFESYSGGSCDSNLTNAAFTAMMANAEGFGLRNELDVYANPPCFGDPAPSGIHKVGMHQANDGTFDEFSLTLSSSLVSGQSYQLALSMESVGAFASGLSRVEIGVSSSPSAFGTLVYSASSTVLDSWELFTTTFSAPLSGQYLTVRALRDNSAIDHWLHIDDIRLRPASGGLGRLFGVNSGTGGNFLVTIDKNTAALTVIGNTSITCDGLAFGSDGTLYAAENGAGNLVTLDPTTGAVASVIGPFVNVPIVEGLACHPLSGELYGIDVINDNLARINRTTGLATIVGPLNGNGLTAGLSWSADGSKLYAIDWGNGCLYDVNPATGNATLIGCGDANEPLGLATDPTNGQLYSADWASGGNMTLSRVDASTGLRTDVGIMVGGQQIEGLAFEPVGLGVKYCTATNNSTGSPADIAASGTANVSNGDLHLESSPVPNQNGIFFHGANQTQVAFGNGFLCASGGIFRGSVIAGSGNLAAYTYDNSDAKHSLGAFSGTTRNFQYWFRDPMGGGSLFNTSNAISIPILP